MLQPLNAADFYDRVARYYDAENAEMLDDLELYAELAATYGQPVLDVGCGTGRVLLHLADAGYRVHGLDISQAMLAIVQRKLEGRADLRERAQTFGGDAASAALPTRYPLILFPYNGFMHFHSTAQQMAVLRHLSQYLAEGGQFVFDLPNAGERFASADDDALTLERMFVMPESGHLVMQHAVSGLDRTMQLEYVTWIYDEVQADGLLRRTVAPMVLRHVFSPELELLLQACGLARTAQYGDYEGGPFESGCPRLIVVAGRV